jgi:hypothetical protein
MHYRFYFKLDTLAFDAVQTEAIAAECAVYLTHSNWLLVLLQV